MAAALESPHTPPLEQRRAHRYRGGGRPVVTSNAIEIGGGAKAAQAANARPDHHAGPQPAEATNKPLDAVWAAALDMMNQTFTYDTFEGTETVSVMMVAPPQDETPEKLKATAPSNPAAALGSAPSAGVFSVRSLVTADIVDVSSMSEYWTTFHRYHIRVQTGFGEHVVLRRYSEFRELALGLQDAFKACHAPVPEFPPKVLGSTSPQVVSYRLRHLGRFIRFVVTIPVLQQHHLCAEFLELPRLVLSAVEQALAPAPHVNVAKCRAVLDGARALGLSHLCRIPLQKLEAAMRAKLEEQQLQALQEFIELYEASDARGLAVRRRLSWTSADVDSVADAAVLGSSQHSFGLASASYSSHPLALVERGMSKCSNDETESVPASVDESEMLAAAFAQQFQVLSGTPLDSSVCQSMGQSLRLQLKGTRV